MPSRFIKYMEFSLVGAGGSEGISYLNYGVGPTEVFTLGGLCSDMDFTEGCSLVSLFGARGCPYKGGHGSS